MLNKMKKLFGTKEEKKSEYELIQSPMTGDIKPLSMVNDAAFAEGTMGEGIAIEPHMGRVVSPVNGVIANVSKTKHSVFLISDYGAEVLIHVGIDTVKLKGEHFTMHVKTGQ